MSTSTNPIGTFPHHPNDVTPQWLTARLKLRGLLTTSCISSITPDFLKLRSTRIAFAPEFIYQNYRAGRTI